jgi:hypothetical protein
MHVSAARTIVSPSVHFIIQNKGRARSKKHTKFMSILCAAAVFSSAVSVQ